MNKVKVGDFQVGDGEKLCVIAGPCLLENAELGMRIAEQMKMLSEKHSFNYIFKSSYEKDNRSIHKGERGLGLDDGLRALQDIKVSIVVLLLSDVQRE